MSLIQNGKRLIQVGKSLPEVISLTFRFLDFRPPQGILFFTVDPRGLALPEGPDTSHRHVLAQLLLGQKLVGLALSSENRSEAQ